MDHLPIFLDLKRGRTVVLGGGEPAAQKIELLIRAGARPLVIAPSVVPEIARRAAEGACELSTRPFTPDCLDGVILLVVAVEDEALAAFASAMAQARGLPVNVVDRPELCSFIMPAIVDRSPVVVAISTGGASPTLAQMIRTRIESVLPPGVSCLAALARSLRPLVRGMIAEPSRRREFWRRALGGQAGALALAGHEAEARRVFVSALRRVATTGAERQQGDNLYTLPPPRHATPLPEIARRV